MKRAILRALGAAAVAALVVLFLLPERPPPEQPLRPAPAVPSPSDTEKAAFFYALLRGGQTIEVAAPLEGATPLEIPVWREVGGAGLVALGQPGLDFVTDPARFPDYVAAPNLLVSVLQLLEQGPAFPGLFPFLAHWLDEGNCPRAVPGSDWPDEIRNLVFLVLKSHPVPEAVPFCVAEFDRPRRAHDLRPVAADILLRLGQAEALNRFFPTLPPTPEVPEPDLRALILERLFHMAGPGAGDRNRAQVRELEPLLEAALGSERAVERFNAMGVLHRIGRPGMEEALIRFFEENRESDERSAWSALLLLAYDGPAPHVREACLRRIEKDAGPPGTADGPPPAAADVGPGFAGAIRILMAWWPDDIAPRLLEWMRRGERPVDPYMSLPQLLRHDRAAVVAWLRGEVRDAAQSELLRALRFAAAEGVTELVPDLLAKAREVDPAARPPFYRALVQLGAPGTESLLLAELSAAIPPELKSAAAVELLNLGGEAGLARLAELLAEGDRPTLDAVLRRAQRLRDGGVPPPLVPAALEALRKMPGEDGRRAALLVLRFRGRLEDVREGLVEAYRHEPSRLVAREIGEAIAELAHR